MTPLTTRQPLDQDEERDEERCFEEEHPHPPPQSAEDREHLGEDPRPDEVRLVTPRILSEVPNVNFRRL